MDKKFNEKSLDTLDAEGAYILGLYCSDGCVCKTTGGRHIVALGLDDKDIVENVRRYFSSTNKITWKKRSNGKIGYRLAFSSRHLYDRFCSLGCVPQKSAKLGQPQIPRRLYSQFILGMIDGDGSISRNGSINSWKLSVGTASHKFCSWFESYLRREGIVYSKGTRRVQNGRFSIVTLTGVSAKYLLCSLYERSGGVTLGDRKHRLFLQLKDVCFRKGPNFMDWELQILRSSLDHQRCAIAINSDKRNYGWTRSVGTIKEKRRSLRAA